MVSSNKQLESQSCINLKAFLIGVYQPIFIIGTVILHFHLLAACGWLFNPLENYLRELSSESLFESLYYMLILPFTIYLWIIVTMLATVIVKTIFFPYGMKVGYFNEELDRWEIKVHSWAYVRWWSVDHFYRCTTPFIYGAIIYKSQLASFWYYLLGMNIDPFETSIVTPFGEVGEWDLWTISGKGTVFAMRAYGFDFDSSDDRILFLKKRMEVRDDVSEECDGLVHYSLAWIGLVPSTMALGLAQYINRNYLFGMENFHTLPSYITLLSMFIIFVLVLTIQFVSILRIFCGETKLGNMVVKCIDIIPKCCCSFSILHVWWLRAIGVGVSSNQIFCGCEAPENPSLINLGKNVFISNAKIVGPVSIGDNCFFGIKARVRPGTKLMDGSGVGGHSITHNNMLVTENVAVVRNWKEKLPPLYTKTIMLRERVRVKNEFFPSYMIHLAYIFPKLLQLGAIWATFSCTFVVSHRIFKTPFFLLHDPTSYAEFLGLISFMLCMLLTMPLLMVLTKWTSVGKWKNCDPKVYFGLNTIESKRYFAFMGGPVWTFVRAVWQPRFYGTWIQNLWYRVLGAKIGSRVLIYSNGTEDYDNLTLEDDVAVCHGCFVLGHIWEGYGLCFGNTTMRSGSTLITDRQVWPGGEIQSRAIVEGCGQPIRGKWPRDTENNKV